MAQKARFLTPYSPPPIQDAPRLPAKKRISPFEFSLCLSRACLGKMMISFLEYLEWRQKQAAFFAPVTLGTSPEIVYSLACEIRSQFFSLIYPRPEPVLVRVPRLVHAKVTEYKRLFCLASALWFSGRWICDCQRHIGSMCRFSQVWSRITGGAS